MTKVTQCQQFSLLNETGAVFVATGAASEVADKRNIFTLEEVRMVIQTSNAMLSFEGVIGFREQSPILESQTRNTVTPKGFGTPGITASASICYTLHDVVL